MKRIINDVVIDSPNNVQRSKCEKNNIFHKTLAIKNIESDKEQYSTSDKKEIIKCMFQKLFLNVMKKMLHALLQIYKIAPRESTNNPINMNPKNSKCAKLFPPMRSILILVIK